MEFATDVSEEGLRAHAIYANLRAEIETPENLGKLLIIDVDTGDCTLDSIGFDAVARLKALDPEARLYALRVGFKSVASLSGMLTRLDPLETETDEEEETEE